MTDQDRLEALYTAFMRDTGVLQWERFTTRCGHEWEFSAFNFDFVSGRCYWLGRRDVSSAERQTSRFNICWEDRRICLYMDRGGSEVAHFWLTGTPEAMVEARLLGWL